MIIGSLPSRPLPPGVLKSEPPETYNEFKTKGSQMKKMVILVTVIILIAGGCSGMSYTEQRVLSGGAMGAAGGAVIGAAAGSAALGAAAGGGAGLLGGYVYDQYQKSRGNP